MIDETKPIHPSVYGQYGVVTSRIEMEFYTTWAEQNPDLFDKRLRDFMAHYSEGYRFSIKVITPHLLQIVADIKEEG
jgi:hypothetical protein